MLAVMADSDHARAQPTPFSFAASSERFKARAGGWLLLAGAVMATLTVTLPHAPRRTDAATWVIAVVAALAALRLLRARRPVAPWQYQALTALGTLLITLAARADGLTGPTAQNDEILYIWVMLYAFYFFSMRAALVQLALAAGAYGLLLNSTVSIGVGMPRWLTTIGTLLIAGVLIGRLKLWVEGLVRELSANARRDALTGVLNRGGFDARFELELARVRRVPGPLSLLLADVDRFKQLNDRFGHPRGDEALKLVARVLRNGVREIDVVGRLGGDEFAVVLPNCDAAAARAVAEELRRGVEREFRAWPEVVTVSVGVASVPPEAPRARELLRAADTGLYGAKTAGRDRTGVAATAATVTPLPVSLRA